MIIAWLIILTLLVLAQGLSTDYRIRQYRKIFKQLLDKEKSDE